MNNQPQKKKLTPEQHRVLREKGTDVPFEGKFYHHKEDGMYHCAGCGAALFDSHSKFDSGSGWPSFDRVACSDAVELVEDRNHGMTRVEVVCASCKGHLGHLFDDGPTATGKRFCVNSSSLDFEKKDV